MLSALRMNTKGPTISLGKRHADVLVIFLRNGFWVKKYIFLENMAAAIDSVEVFHLAPADGLGLKDLIKIQDVVLFLLVRYF